MHIAGRVGNFVASMDDAKMFQMFTAFMKSYGSAEETAKGNDSSDEDSPHCEGMVYILSLIVD